MRRLGRESRRSHERSSVLGFALRLPLSPAPCSNPERWEAGQRSDLAQLWAASQNSKRDAARDRRTAREASLCLDSPSDRAEEQRRQADHAARTQESSLVAQNTSQVPMICSMRCRKIGGLADQRYMDDGDILSPDLSAAFSARVRRSQRQSRSGAEPTENRSHLPT